MADADDEGQTGEERGLRSLPVSNAQAWSTDPARDSLVRPPGSEPFEFRGPLLDEEGPEAADAPRRTHGADGEVSSGTVSPRDEHVFSDGSHTSVQSSSSSSSGASSSTGTRNTSSSSDEITLRTVLGHIRQRRNPGNADTPLPDAGGDETERNTGNSPQNPTGAQNSEPRTSPYPREALWSLCGKPPDTTGKPNTNIKAFEKYLTERKEHMDELLEDIGKNSILERLIDQNQPEKLKKLLETCEPLDANTADDNDGETPLHRAVQKNRPECACVLVECRMSRLAKNRGIRTDQTSAGGDAPRAYIKDVKPKEDQILFYLPMEIVEAYQELETAPYREKLRVQNEDGVNRKPQLIDKMKVIRGWMSRVEDLMANPPAPKQPLHRRIWPTAQKNPDDPLDNKYSYVLESCRNMLVRLCYLCFNKGSRTILQHALLTGLHKDNVKTLAEIVGRCPHPHRQRPQCELKWLDDGMGLPSSTYEQARVGQRSWIERCILLTVMVRMAVFNEHRHLHYIASGAKDLKTEQCKKCLKTWQELYEKFKERDAKENTRTALKAAQSHGDGSRLAFYLLLCQSQHQSKDSGTTLNWEECGITDLTWKKIEDLCEENEFPRSTMDVLQRNVNNVDNVDLSKNRELTMVPGVVFRVHNLTYLDLSDTRVTHANLQASAKIFNQPHLMFLHLSGLLLTKLPEDLVITKSLKDLALSRNKLTRLPAAIYSSHICKLDLSDNHFVKLDDNIGDMKYLVKLDLSSNRYLKSLPPSLGYCSVEILLEGTRIQTRNARPGNEWENAGKDSIEYYEVKQRHGVGKVLLVYTSLEEADADAVEFVKEKLEARARELDSDCPMAVLNGGTPETLLHTSRLLCDKYTKFVIVYDEERDLKEAEKVVKASSQANEPLLVCRVQVGDLEADKQHEDDLVLKKSSEGPGLHDGSTYTFEDLTHKVFPKPIDKGNSSNSHVHSMRVPKLFCIIHKWLVPTTEDRRPMFLPEDDFKQKLNDLEEAELKRNNLELKPTVKPEQYYRNLYDFLLACGAAVRLPDMSDTEPVVICTNLNGLSEILAYASHPHQSHDVQANREESDRAYLERFIGTDQDNESIEQSPILFSILQSLDLAYLLPNGSQYVPLWAKRQNDDDSLALLRKGDTLFHREYSVGQQQPQQHQQPQPEQQQQPQQ
eukprot:scpid27446/ scgid1698/ 